MGHATDRTGMETHRGRREVEYHACELLSIDEVTRGTRARSGYFIRSAMVGRWSHGKVHTWSRGLRVRVRAPVPVRVRGSGPCLCPPGAFGTSPRRRVHVAPTAAVTTASTPPRRCARVHDTHARTHTGTHTHEQLSAAPSCPSLSHRGSSVHHLSLAPRTAPHSAQVAPSPPWGHPGAI